VWHVRLQIGTKLGLSALIGILLVAGLIANDRFSKSHLVRVGAEAEREKQLMIEGMSAMLAVRGAQQQIGSIRLATSQNAIDVAVAELERLGASGQLHLSTAQGLTRDAAHRERLSAIDAKFADSLTAANDIARTQTVIVRLETERDQIWRSWTARIRAIEERLAPSASPLLTQILSADASFKTANNSALQFRMLQDETAMTAASIANERTAAALRRARDLAADAESIRAIAALSDLDLSFRRVLHETTLSSDQQSSIIANRTSALTAEISKLIDQVLAEGSLLSQRADIESKDTSERAATYAVAIGLAVIAILMALAVLSQVHIGRPIRAIGDVLLELARGNLNVRIPYRERGDELGDTARAAEKFRGQLVQLAELEASKAETAQRAADQRKRRRTDHRYRRTCGERPRSRRRHAGAERRQHADAVRLRGTLLHGSLVQRAIGRRCFG
jgi:HAMP domain-containing protein